MRPLPAPPCDHRDEERADHEARKAPTEASPRLRAKGAAQWSLQPRALLRPSDVPEHADSQAQQRQEENRTLSSHG